MEIQGRQGTRRVDFHLSPKVGVNWWLGCRALGDTLTRS